MRSLTRKEEIVKAVCDYFFCDSTSENMQKAQEIYKEGYVGAYKDLGQWAQERAEETGTYEEIPEHLRYYVDWDAYARDCEINGEIWSIEIGSAVHVLTCVYNV
jgi:antirestriction protein